MNRINLSRLNPYNLHKHLINEYILTKPGSSKLFQRDTSKDKTDIDVIRENHRFLWNTAADTWEKQLAKKYYDKLFKEYCICELNRYKENKVALRWRVESEVVIGKGQFICGNKSCTEKNELRSWEVNFAYIEYEEKKNALIKLRLCPSCSNKLNYHSKKREVKRIRKRVKKTNSNKRKHGQSDTEVQNMSDKSKIKERNESTHESTQESNSDDDNEETSTKPEVPNLPENTWTKAPEIEDKSREEEFDEYLENLLL